MVGHAFLHRPTYDEDLKLLLNIYAIEVFGFENGILSSDD